MIKTIQRILMIMACLCGMISTSSQANEKPGGFVFAVHPYLSEREITQRFTPLIKYLENELQEPVRLAVAASYREHIEAIGRNKVDIAFLGPVAYVRLTEVFGYKPILGRFEVAGQENLYGIIATRTDSEIGTLNGLAGARFAFGSKESTMSHIVPRYMMMQAGLSLGLPRAHHFLGSHGNVALGVLAGDYNAGAMKKEVFEKYASRGLKQLAITMGVPDHLFVARTDMPDKRVSQIRAVLSQLKQSDSGQRILTELHGNLTGIIQSSDVDYDVLRIIVRDVDLAIKAPVTY